jgi:tRNA threonylcarbamoyladenosine biosynthesis protein TsaE
MSIDLAVRTADAEDAQVVTDLIHRAFAGRPPLDPPTTQLAETPETVGAALAAGAGLLATVDGQPAGTMIFTVVEDSGVPLLGLRRVSVLPQWQGRGVATAMVGVAEAVARSRGLAGVSLVARRELGATVEFWRRRGYVVEAGAESAAGPELPMRKRFGAGVLALSVATAADMHTLGRVLAGELAAGDLVLLVGELGAGKTTLTQGIGAGLEVTGQITSPTFVISRVHRATGRRPSLIHVDAYRLSGGGELDDLDLDASTDAGVTVVEWGEGLAEALSPDRLIVRLTRLPADLDDVTDPDPDATVDDPRTAILQAVGTRWTDDALNRIAHRYRTYTDRPAAEPGSA